MTLSPQQPLSLYFHWPYCAKKCPYCDFNVHREDTALDIDTWRRAYHNELDHHYARTSKHRLVSLFFGGGSPSRMPPSLTQSLIDHCLKRWASAPDLEITLEVNPSDAHAIADYAACGINRFSVGGQSLVSSRLAFLGRDHSPEDVCVAIDSARQHTDNVSVDFISCLPHDTSDSWQQELEQIVVLPVSHLSIYGLTIEPDTPFHRDVSQHVWHPLHQDQQARIYRQTRTTLQQHGFQPYEISSYARRHQCRHNLTYWRYGSYLGIGPGSHGRLHQQGETLAWQNHKKPQHWLDHCLKRGHGTEQETPLTQDEQTSEFLLMGLRLRQGIHERDSMGALNRPLSSLIDPNHARACIEARWLEQTADTLRLTDEGLLRLDSLVALLTSSYSSSASASLTSASLALASLTLASLTPNDVRPRPTTSSSPFLT